MKLEIDTKNDSVEDIKKMIEFLSKFVSESPDNSSTPDASSGTFNMFSDDSVPEKKEDKDDDDDKYSGISIVEY
ncbi:MAG: hypothetical protein KJ583_04235 [Nanoarchaeota archaeon]|nr:hypothetical protein [Nanoarchaeota archaeon]MBU1269097.1 hypothetical protein [Nanoarchaeota archaeon]MBU1604501.1 hypothetical protein [Nanoarchaeota archaeon]MBU2442991.1 hypothetical protein [Nanoarchaeota archaeon]